MAAGGHAIPELSIRERWVKAPLRLIDLMPRLHELRAFDNSAEAEAGQPVEDPRPALHVQQGVLCCPLILADLQRTPGWAKLTVQAARDLGRGRLQPAPANVGAEWPSECPLVEGRPLPIGGRALPNPAVLAILAVSC